MNRFDIRRQLLNSPSPSTPRKTRYDWDAILAEYPKAMAATTDETGRMDLWTSADRATFSTTFRHGEWWTTGRTALVCGRYHMLGNTPDWENSFEERPK